MPGNDLVRFSNGRINRMATVLAYSRQAWKDIPFTPLDIWEGLHLEGCDLTYIQVKHSLKALKQYKLGIGRDIEGMYVVCEPGEIDDHSSPSG